MADDGSERNLAESADREIFSLSGHTEVESEAVDDLSLIASYSNSK